MTVVVTEREPRGDSLTARDPGWDYRDRFTVNTTAGQYDTVDQVVSDWFTQQPFWIRLLSTNTVSLAAVARIDASGGYRVGSAIGSWRVVHRDEHEIVFGDSLGFMKYWYSLALPSDAPNTVEGSTAVRYLWRRTGGFYFTLVRPFHQLFVKLALAKTVS